MDHKRFRDWFSHVDELTAVQRKELAAVLSDAAEGAASLAAIELGVDDERRCPHCASADAVNYLWVYAEEHGVADRMVVVMGSDFGRTNFYNSVNGKDHWPIGSYVGHREEPVMDRACGGRNGTDLPPSSGPSRMLVHCRFLSQAGWPAERSGAGRPAWHDDRLRGRRPVSQAAVWTCDVVMAPPGFDENLGFLQGVEDLGIIYLTEI